VIRLARLDVIEHDALLLAEPHEGLRDKFRPVVAPQHRRRAVHRHPLFQHLYHAYARQRRTDLSIASASRLPSSSTFSVP